MSKAKIEVKEATTFEEAEKAVLEFKDTHFLRAITNDDNRKAFIEKHLQYGHFLVEYHDEIPVGFFSFYCNDAESKTAYITSLALKDELGFLKGKTLIRLLTKGFAMGKEADMKSVRLEVEKDNKKAIKLYEHFGFKVVPSEKEETYYMEMKLADYKF